MWALDMLSIFVIIYWSYSYPRQNLEPNWKTKAWLSLNSVLKSILHRYQTVLTAKFKYTFTYSNSSSGKQPLSNIEEHHNDPFWPSSGFYLVREIVRPIKCARLIDRSRLCLLSIFAEWQRFKREFRHLQSRSRSCPFWHWNTWSSSCSSW